MDGSGITAGMRLINELIIPDSSTSLNGWSTKGTFIFGQGWRNIQFIWINDSNQSPGNSNYELGRGYWLETGRQILSPRSLTAYTGVQPPSNDNKL